MESDSKETKPKDETKKTKSRIKGAPKKLGPKVNKFVHTRSFILVLIFVLACLPALYFYNKNRQAEKLLKDPNTANQQVINEVVKKVGRHILLPTGEQPTLASITDVNKVKGQPFFANAQNGDKVLVYTQARKAFLYRPDKDIIIEVAPLNVGQL